MKVKILLLAFMLGIGTIANSDFSFSRYEHGKGLVIYKCKEMLAGEDPCFVCIGYFVNGAPAGGFTNCGGGGGEDDDDPIAPQ